MRIRMRIREVEYKRESDFDFDLYSQFCVSHTTFAGLTCFGETQNQTEAETDFNPQSHSYSQTGDLNSPTLTQNAIIGAWFWSWLALSRHTGCCCVVKLESSEFELNSRRASKLDYTKLRQIIIRLRLLILFSVFNCRVESILLLN